MYAGIVTSHGNPHLSGVAKFNHILADLLNVPLLRIADLAAHAHGKLLLSIKLSDAAREDLTKLCAYVDEVQLKGGSYDIFFHTFEPSQTEHALVHGCTIAYAGNAEIEQKLSGIAPAVRLAFCPALINPKAIVTQSQLTVFSFGMAHKIQTERHRRLHEALTRSGRQFTLWMSTAFHEKSHFGDFQSISEELGSIYADRIRFLGFLSDDAVNYFLDRSNLFVGFFERGVRANNTSVYAAMGRGCAVLTNRDQYSPSWHTHGFNILDIDRIGEYDFCPEALKQIGEQGRIDSEMHASWDSLITLLREA